MNRPKLLRFLLLLLVITLPALAEKVATMPAPAGYINDYADVISSPAKTSMEDLCQELHNKTKAQVFVVTINSLDGLSVEEFSNQLFHQWKIGEKKTDRGVLLLLAIKDHKYRIEVGYGLESILKDAKAGDIGRDMVPFLRADDYSAAANSALRAVSKIIADDSHVTLDTLQQNPEPFQDTTPSEPTSPDENPNAHVKLYVTLLVCAWFSIFGLVIVLIRRANKKGRLNGSGSSSGGGFWSSSGGSSSDDDSFSGGDGGDSGGGGASGSW